MTKEELSTYKTVKDNNWPLLLAILFSGLVFMAFFNEIAYIIFGVVYLTALPLYVIYRPRKCPECQEKMKRFPEKGFFPDAYYCEKSKVKITSAMPMWM